MGAEALTGHYFVMEDTFKIRAYGFQELAQLYLPDIQPRSASMRLKIWIERSPSLCIKLQSIGYFKGCRMLTPEMVKEIVSIIGEP